MSEKLTNLLLVGLMIVSIGLFAHRNYGGAASNNGGSSVTYRTDWKKIRDTWGTAEDTTAKVQIIEFADFQCAACRDFAEVTVPELRKKYDVSLTVVNLPLSGHEHAPQAARMFVCAKERAFPLHDVLYAKQDSLGKKPWVEYAIEAGVTDVPAWEACVADTTSRVKVEGSKALASKLGIAVTPTILINGWQLTGGSRSIESLSATIDATLEGKKPPVPN